VTLKSVHPEGFYEKYPEVTWDLAEERWLGHGGKGPPMGDGRTGVLLAECQSCGWSGCADDLVLAKPERLRVQEWITGSRHWYQCPERDPQIEFLWAGPGWLAEQLGYGKD
jgi:hypothetical protein